MENSLRGYTMINELALDYITLVSAQVGRIQRLWHMLTKESEETATGTLKDIQNTSVSCGGVLAGPAPRHKPNTKWVLQVPGLLAETAAQYVDIEEDTLWCSRFDLQVTIPVQESIDITSMYRVLTNSEKYPWRQTGRKPEVTRYENSHGGETLYIGKRSSNVMTRMYKKDVDGLNCMRWEIEIKGPLAREMCDKGILRDKGMQATLCRSIISGYPGKAEQYMMPFTELMDEGNGELKRSGYEASDARTLDWLANTALPALRRAMAGRFRAEVLNLLIEHDVPLSPEAVASARLTNIASGVEYESTKFKAV
jgi:hypothetical protein